ncbi:MAG TPA: hypothetical protein VLK85_36080 [Ramlibacter sp.]|nr:hypothetical protein [Ramlibacter sp.]
MQAIIRRILSLVPLLLIITLLAFLMVKLIPGSVAHMFRFSFGRYRCAAYISDCFC